MQDTNDFLAEKLEVRDAMAAEIQAEESTQATLETPNDTMTDDAATDGGTVEADEVDAAGSSRANREAANYRRRLRETETERDQLRESLEAARRQLVEAQLAECGYKPAAFWAAENSVHDFFDEAGNMDSKAVSVAAFDMAEKFGLQSNKWGSADAGARKSYVPTADWNGLLTDS